MRYDDFPETQTGIDESTAGFVDIQFGLIAVLILALSVTTKGLVWGSEQLERSQSGSNVFVQMFLGDATATRDSLSCAIGEGMSDSIRFGEHLALCAEWADGVAVLGPWGENGTLFDSAESELPDGADSVSLIDRLQSQTLNMFPCIAPLDRNMAFEQDGMIAFAQILQQCEETYYPLAASALAQSESKEEGPISLRLPGLDLFVIEGHADGEPPSGANISARNENAAVAGARAQRVLYAMLTPRNIDSDIAFFDQVNDLDWDELPYKIDDLTTNLPGRGLPRGYQSGLLDLVPLSRRVFQECYLYVQSLEIDPEEAAAAVPIWCAGLIDLPSEGSIDSEGFVRVDREALFAFRSTAIGQTEGLRIPRLFALSNYGRLSLRHGELGKEDNRDRRVEFRFLTAAIPANIHQLVRESQEPSYYVLYTAAATMELHNCDLERARTGAQNKTCVERLNRLVLGTRVSR